LSAAVRIAHLSDVHALDPRPPKSKTLELKLIALGGIRRLDPEVRAKRLERAVRAGKDGGATHFVISGDLTEMGMVDQFEAFADALSRAGIDPERVTLVPGNHDAYHAPDGWKRALDGPLRPYARTSAPHVVDLGEAVLLPVSTARHQHMAFSSGEVTRETAEDLEKRLSDPGISRRAVAVVQHHPPYRRKRVIEWIDGLLGRARVEALLERHPRMQVLHGHLHHLVDRVLGSCGRPRVLGAPAVVDDRDDAPRVRLYDVKDGMLEPVTR
jgi:Icc protein